MSHKKNSLKTRLISKLMAGLICAIGALPISANRALGTFIGWLLCVLPNSNRHTTRVNMQLCFPDWTDEQRKALEKASLIEAGRGVIEVAYVWRNPHKALSLINSIRGDDILADAMATGRPVVVLAPHHGNWELMNYWLSSHYAMHILFMPSGLPDVDALIQKSRETFDSTAYPITKEGVAEFNKTLQEGNVITGVLPDQVALRNRGIFVDFFGQPAYTSPHACRLIQKHNAIPVVLSARRCADKIGFDIAIEAVDDAIYDDDLSVSLPAMNKAMADFIMQVPEQYLWSYKRFRRQPDGKPNPYK